MVGLLGIFILVVIVFYTWRTTRDENIERNTMYGKLNDFTPVEMNVGLYSDDDLSFLVNTLKREFPFYSKMTENERKEFATRTYKIRKSKEFYGMEDFIMTPKHEIVICATLARLTFGLNNRFELPSFEMIQVYPREFYSRLIEQHAKGLTLGNGRIFLSWKHFEEGHQDDDDKIHVGLHEFAHAMMIEYEMFEYAPPWENWRNHAAPVMQVLGTSEAHFFRKYGATNIHEFWAVAVETFFEQPFEFRKEYYELYNATVAMLNQDPCARMEIIESI